MLSTYGTWHENLIEDAPKSKRNSGNFVSSGRLNPRETNQLLEELIATDPLNVRSADWHTGSVLSLYVMLGNEENKVANFQSNWEATDSPAFHFSSFVHSYQLFEEQWEALSLRYKRGEVPDGSQGNPGDYWLTKEEQSLFSLYANRLPGPMTSNLPSQ